LIEGFRADFVLADKGYDSDAFVDIIKGSGTTPVITPRSNRKTPRDYDKDIYKERNLVERLFQKLKEYRRVATHYERLALNYNNPNKFSLKPSPEGEGWDEGIHIATYWDWYYMAMLNLVSTLIWLK
jgi:hypothetical protein